MIGQTILQFKILKKLGESGMGVVNRTKNTIPRTTFLQTVKNTYLRIAGVMLLLSLPVNLLAQKDDIKFEHLTVEDGLSSNTVLSILLDSRGFMWFGTSEGLNRYDGYAFKEYRHDPTDSTSISDNFIWFDCLYEDSFGMIWVGTRTAGLSRFDPITETFKRFQHDPNDDSSLSTNHGIGLGEDRSGVLWVGTDEGLNRFDRATETFQRFLHDPDDATSLAHNRIWEIRETGQGDNAELWIATHRGLDRFDRTTERFEHMNLDGLYPKGAKLAPITDIYDDQRGTLWIGSLFGLVRLDLQTMKTQFYRHDPENKNSLNFNVVTGIWQDPGTQGRVLWLTTRRGLNRFDTETETFSHYTYDPAKPDGLNATGVVSLYEDMFQRLWIGSHTHGINKLNRQVQNFNLTKHEPDDPNGLKGWEVRAIHDDRIGDLWIGTDAGLNKLDRETGVFTKYTFGSDTLSVVSSNVVTGIAEDENGILWLGTWGGGLIRFDPHTGQFHQYRHEPTNPNSLANDQVGRVFFDSYGTLWLGTAGQVLSQLLPQDHHTGRFTHFKPEPEYKISLENHMAFAFLEDSYGGFWVGSHLNGLYRFNRETGQFTAYKHDQNDPNSLSSNIVNGMFETRSERDTIMWVGTGYGLNRFDRSSQTFKRIYNNQPGGSDFIFSLTGDAGNSLWIQNNKGISKFNTHRETFINFAGSRGLPADMSNCYGYHRNGKGEIFFGGMGGLIYFHPDSILSNQHVPPVMLTDFKVLNDPVVLDSSITMKKRIDLTHDQNFFSFEFAALDYTDSKKNQYAYKLEGLDAVWIENGSRRLANYTAVRPGSYIFRVKGSNNDGVWNEEGVSIIITIRPPWWDTRWAYAVYLLFFLSALYSVRRYEMGRLHLRSELKIKNIETEKMQEVDRLKSRFFASISHEFRTPLTLILGPVGKWLSRIQQSEMKSDFHIVQRNAWRLEQLINQLLDLSKLDAGKMNLRTQPQNIVKLIRMITMAFESLAKQKGISLQFRTLQKEIIAYVERDKLEKIITNLLSNAFTFTGDGGAVKVEVAAEKKELPTARSATGFVEIRVSDTGVGISVDQLDKIFDRFHQVDNGTAHGGTGIGLALTKELVELHHGCIAVESKSGRGTRFTVRLPLGKDHLKPEQIAETVASDPFSGVGEQFRETSSQHPVSDQQSIANNELPILLIVEDNPEMRTYMRGYLEESYRIIEAENGVQGEKQAYKHAPDLIISDVMMPEMDGFELCKKLKTDERTSHIPVILLTARASGDSKLEGLEIGADDYLTKPFDIKELQARARNLIEQRRKLRERFRRQLVIQPAEVTVNSMDEAFLKKVMATVEVHIDDPSFETDDLARECAIGRRQLNRKLRALTGQSVRAFIRTIRLKRAAQLLRQQTGTVTEIAYDVGFNSIAHFAKIFRQQFGVTPSEYEEIVE